MGTREPAIVGSWEVVCPESCPNRILPVTPMRNLQRPFGLENLQSEFRSGHLQEDSYQWETLQMLRGAEPPSHAHFPPSKGVCSGGQHPWCAQLADIREPALRRNPSKCGKSFQQNYDFPNHQKSHIGDNLGICLECGRSIRWRAFLGLLHQ